MRRRHHTPLLLAALLASVAACSDDSTDSAATSTGSAPGTSAPSTEASTQGAAIPTLSWQACPAAPEGSASRDGFECATATVPMDHAVPDGDTFELAVIRHPAGDGSAKIGTLLFNPGGPGDTGTHFLPATIGGFPDEVQQRFDIVSWDPRGMGGGTTPVVQCFESADEEAAFLDDGPADLPVTDDALTTFFQFRTRLNERCVAHAGDLLSHVSTADNARDIDLLRRALGDERVSYYGTSYGTFLGATFINMFPETVDTAVLDGAVFPTAWSELNAQDPSLTTFLRLGSDLGTASTVAEFIRQCGMVDATQCAFSAGTPEATADKWTALLERLKLSPVNVDGEPTDDAALLTNVQSSLYITKPIPGLSRFPGWFAVGQLIQDAYEATEPSATSTSTTMAASSESLTPSAPESTGPAGPKPYTTSAGRQLAVICGESPNPTDEQSYIESAKASYERAGINGWPLGPCLGWTARATSPYLGPWDTYAEPVLVIGNTFDPATPYTSSERMAEELADGHLVTVDGFGHTQLANPSQCAKDAIAAYLIDGMLPPDGTRCTQDQGPFDSS